MKHIIYKESIYFQKFIFIQKYKQKNGHLPIQLYVFFVKKLQKKIQKFIHMKKKIGQKDIQFFKKK
jgi:hypothetical protein